MNFLRRLSFYLNNKGIAAIEFALVAPIIILLTYGILEVTRYSYFHQKVADSSSQMVNIVNQNLNLSKRSINIIFEASQDIMLPFENLEYVMILTALQKNSAVENELEVLWQIREGEADGDGGSRIAPDGKGSDIEIEGLTMRPRDQIIVVEILTRYKPMLDSNTFFGMGFVDEYIYKSSMARPRYGAFQFEPK